MRTVRGLVAFAVLASLATPVAAQKPLDLDTCLRGQEITADAMASRLYGPGGGGSLNEVAILGKANDKFTRCVEHIRAGSPGVVVSERERAIFAEARAQLIREYHLTVAGIVRDVRSLTQVAGLTPERAEAVVTRTVDMRDRFSRLLRENDRETQPVIDAVQALKDWALSRRLVRGYAARIVALEAEAPFADAQRYPDHDPNNLRPNRARLTRETRMSARLWSTFQAKVAAIPAEKFTEDDGGI